MTISSRSFLVGSIQSTIFIDIEGFSTSRIMSQLFPVWSELFPGDPETIPMPPSTALPPEIPRIILKDEDGGTRLEIALARLNYHKRFINVQDTDALEQFYGSTVSIFNDFKNATNCVINRLAAVKASYVFLDEPGIYLANHFCKEEWTNKPLNKPSSFELHSHKRYTFREHFEVNSWVRSKTGKYTKEGEKRPIILVEQDINTLSENKEKNNFDHALLDDFYLNIDNEFNKTIDLYYPEQ